MDKRTKLVLGGALLAGAAVGFFYLLKGLTGDGRKQAIVSVLKRHNQLMAKTYYRLAQRSRPIKSTKQEAGKNMPSRREYSIFRNSRLDEVSEELLGQALQEAKLSREEFKNCVGVVYAKDPEVLRWAQIVELNLERAQGGQEVDVDAELPKDFNKFKFLSYALSLADEVTDLYLEFTSGFIGERTEIIGMSNLFTYDLNALDTDAPKERLFLKFGFFEGPNDPALVYLKAKQVYLQEDPEFKGLLDRIDALETYLLSRLCDGLVAEAEQLQLPQLRQEVKLQSDALWKAVSGSYGPTVAAERVIEESVPPKETMAVMPDADE